MSIKEKLENNLHEAMRSNDEIAKKAIRMAMASIKNMEIDKKATLDDAAVLAILQKEIKSLNETIEEAKKISRTDIIEENQKQINVLEKFLPAQMSETELKEIVKNAIEEVGARLPADMGKVMKIVLPKVQGRAANDKVSQIVKELLTTPS